MSALQVVQDPASRIEANAVYHDGYVPRALGIGGGDYIEFEVCLNCGQMQGKYPIAPVECESVSVCDVCEYEWRPKLDAREINCPRCAGECEE
jgi:hypothetical protein